jgi:hypothetical protein
MGLGSPLQLLLLIGELNDVERVVLMQGSIRRRRFEVLVSGYSILPR